MGARHGWEWAEPLVDAVTLAHFGLLVLAPPELGGVRVERSTLVICLVIATVGELFLSIAWGLYAYRSSLLPAFVPPGHVLLFLTGVALTRQRWCRDWIVWAVALAALPVLGVLVLRGHDRLSVPLFALFVACLVFGAERKLYAVMFALALGLELLGTALGTWRWYAHVPVLGFEDGANPPLAAGAFYACLDLLTGWVRRAIARRPDVAEEVAEPGA